MAGDVAGVYSGACQLFELFLLATFRAFSDVAVTDIVGETALSATSQQAPAVPDAPDEVCSRLRQLLHIPCIRSRAMSLSVVKAESMLL